MTNLVNKALDNRTFSRLEELRQMLLEKYPKLADAPIERQLDLAMKVLNAHKMAIQKSKLFFDFLPWVIALVALLR